jgi:sugar lactone lactonase YvrE
VRSGVYDARTLGRGALFVSLVVSSAMLSGCKDDGAPPPTACATIDSQGGTVSSDDGVLNLAFRPGSLEEATQVCIQQAKAAPEGPPAIYGTAYRVQPDIDLGVPVNVTYRAALPEDPALAVILRQDFEMGQGRWLTLEANRIEPENELISGRDTRLSMYYGLIDGSGDGMVSDSVGDTDGDASSGDGSATSGDSTTGDATTTSDPSTTSDGSTTSSTDPTDPSGSTGGDSSGSTGGAAFGCDDLPAVPLEIERVGNSPVFPMGGSEDIAMVGDGTFVGVNGNEILLSDGNGYTETWFEGPLSASMVLGLKFDNAGDLFIANAQAGVNTTINRISGGVESVYSQESFVFPNGVFVDSNGHVWVSDFSGNSLHRVEEMGVTHEEMAELNQPNGIFLDENRSILFWSQYGTSQIWQAPVDGEGNLGTPTMTADLPPGGNTDGITMDECGNLYAVSRTNNTNPCRLERVHLDPAGDLDEAAGGVVELAADGEIGNGCANPVFGFGFGDEGDRSVWVAGMTGDVYRVEVGVGGYPISMPH